MQKESTLYGIIGLLAGGLVTLLFVSYGVNNGNTSMMRMMGMGRGADRMGSQESYMMQQRKSEYDPNMMGMGSSMNEMMDYLEGKTGDEFDKAFIELMIEHHQGAIDMANLIPSRTNHEELRNMGEDIVSVQSAEIEMMNGWLKDWFK